MVYAADVRNGEKDDGEKMTTAYNTTREDFTTLESYHGNNDLILRLSIPKLNIRIMAFSLQCNIQKICTIWLASAVHCWMIAALWCVKSWATFNMFDEKLCLSFSRTKPCILTEMNEETVFEEVLLLVWTWLNGVNERTGWWLGEMGWRGRME